ncbi:hypothetical protein AA0119_g13652, partial [Alternaria tenuissima]
KSPEALWRLVKWAKTRENPAPVVTPAIQHPETQQEVTDPAKKADIFRDTFFPVPPEADLEDIRNAHYDDQVDMPPVTEKEVRDAIRAASPLKAPGPDGIINKALQAGLAQLAIHLTRIFNQSLHLGYCPAHFRESTTVVLRKPGKDDYTAPKSYRPIALMNTTGKIMDAVIARRLSYLAETYHVLPPTHMGGRKMRSTEHALHAWIASFLSNRHTSIAIDGFRSTAYQINTDIPQGSPLSPILYLFYNADLIDECNQAPDAMSTGYIDDVGILAWGQTTEQTCETLGKTLEKAQRWASTHASVFAPNKFQLTHFTRSRKRINTEASIHTEWG